MLWLLPPVDFENPAAIKSYPISIRSFDLGGFFYDQSFILNIVDVNEPPTAVVLSSNTIYENATSGTIVGKLSTKDPDTFPQTFTYVLTDDAFGTFYLKGTTLLLTYEGYIHYDYQSVISIEVEVTDNGGLSYTQQLDIDVIDVNYAPSDIYLTNYIVDSASLVGTSIATVSAYDHDYYQTLTYELLDDGGYFALEGTELVLAREFPKGFYGQLQITVQVSDDYKPPATTTNIFHIDVTDGGNPIVNISLSNTTAEENQPPGIIVGEITATMMNETFIIVNATLDNSFNFDFKIVQINQSFFLATNTTLNYESIWIFLGFVTIRVSNSEGIQGVADFYIQTIDTNDPPKFDYETYNFSIPLDLPSNVSFGSVRAYDEDWNEEFSNMTYALLNTSVFQINPKTAELSSLVASLEGLPSTFYFQVVVTDAVGINDTCDVFVEVISFNFAPTFYLNNTYVKERSPIGTIVSAIIVNELNSNQTIVCELVDNANGTFVIENNTLIVAQDTIDYTIHYSFEIVITCYDDGVPYASTTDTTYISVEDVNDIPTDMTVYPDPMVVDENADDFTLVGVFNVVDPDANWHYVFEITAAVGVANVSDLPFTFYGDSLYVTGLVDYATQSSYYITVFAYDAYFVPPLNFTKNFTVIVQNVPEPPSSVYFVSGGSVEEESAQNTLVGVLGVVDEDSDTKTYAFAVSDFYNQFTVDGNNLLVGPGPPLNYDQNGPTMFITIMVFQIASLKSTFLWA